MADFWPEVKIESDGTDHPVVWMPVVTEPLKDSQQCLRAIRQYTTAHHVVAGSVFRVVQQRKLLQVQPQTSVAIEEVDAVSPTPPQTEEQPQPEPQSEPEPAATQPVELPRDTDMEWAQPNF